MKVVLVSSGLADAYGGSAISEASLCAKLGSLVDLTVLCPAERCEDSFWRRYGLRDVRRFTPADAVVAWANPHHWLARLIHGTSVVHVNGHWRWDTWFLTRLLERSRIPYLLHPRGMLLVGHRRVALKRVFNRLLGNAVVRDAARIIALSHFEKRHFVPYRVDPARIIVLPNGIDRPAAPAPSPSAERYFLYLGRVETRKNLPFLLDAFSRYRQNGGKARLLVVGPAEKGHDVELRSLVHGAGLDGAVAFPPPAYDGGKWAYLQGAVAVLYPTREEPFGRVPFEALAAGSVPILPDASGGAEYLRGFLPTTIYRDADAASLADVMGCVEREPPRDGMDHARAWVRKELDWDRIASRVLSLYEEVSGKPREAQLSQL